MTLICYKCKLLTNSHQKRDFKFIQTYSQGGATIGL